MVKHAQLKNNSEKICLKFLLKLDKFRIYLGFRNTLRLLQLKKIERPY